MGENTLKTIVFGLVLFVAFSWLILTVAIDFGAEYGMSSSQIGDGSLDVADFQSSANSVEGNASVYRTSFEDGSVDDVDDATGIFGTIKKFVNLITTPFKLVGQVLENILGVPSLVTNIILGLLSIGLILAFWRVLRSGS